MSEEKSRTERTVDDVVEHAKEKVETYAGKSTKYDGEKAAWFSGLRAAYAGIVEEFGTDEDFEEALLRGSDAERAEYVEGCDDER